MGMFDYIRYGDEEYQTKDTPSQGLDLYEIRNTELWFKDVELEWVKDGGLFGGYFKEVSHEWKFCGDFDGQIRFYREDKENGGHKKDKWIEYHALFSDGKMIKIKQKKGSE